MRSRKLGRPKIALTLVLAVREILELVARNGLLELHHVAGGNPQLASATAVNLQRINHRC